MDITGDKASYTLTWAEWASRIDANFEKHFWVGEDSHESPHVNKRGIYKDTLNSSVPWTDYQLRPNFLIALTVAPQMVNPEHARRALEMCTLHLVNEENSVGIKTLGNQEWGCELKFRFYRVRHKFELGIENLFSKFWSKSFLMVYFHSFGKVTYSQRY